MKKTKAILVALCAVLLIAASVMGTLAWLTSEATVTNTFTVGNVTITLDEAAVGKDGKALPNGSRVRTNSYKLIPGYTYDKDPTVHVVQGSESCYLFVKVENGIANIEATSDRTTVNAYQNIADQMTANGWKLVPGTSNIYIYAPDNSITAVEAGEHGDVIVFKQFKINSEKSSTELEQVAGANANPKAKITVTAYAVQAEGFEGKRAEQIWNATFGAASGT